MPKFCPHIMDECLQDKCMHWQTFPMARQGDPINAPAIMQEDCAFNWSARFAFQQCQQLFGNQAAVESFRNEMCERYDETLRLADARKRARLINATG